MHTQGHSEHAAPGVVADRVERRTGQEVRERFEGACELLAPFFDPANQWSNMSLDHLAMRVLREHFPSLSWSETTTMLNAVRNLHRSRRKPAPFSQP